MPRRINNLPQRQRHNIIIYTLKFRSKQVAILACYLNNLQYERSLQSDCAGDVNDRWVYIIHEMFCSKYEKHFPYNQIEIANDCRMPRKADFTTLLATLGTYSK